MAPEKVFLEVARKLLEFTFGDWSVWGRQPPAGSRGSARVGSRGQSPRIFLHGLQFRFNEITYFLEHSFIGYAVLKWSNLEFTFEVGGSLVAADPIFLEPCHAVIHAKILTGINRGNFAVKN